MNRKGFTLIELLAVIIILGILMIIAIPSVTRYINDSRKSSYVDTAKEIIGSARNLVNSGDLEMYDTDTTYYIDYNCITTENAAKSPYDDFDLAYVVVTYDGKGYTYYWTSIDKAKQGIKNIIRFDKLETDNVESDLDPNDISTLRGIDGRSQTIVVSKANKCQKEGSNPVEVSISGETGKKELIVYPRGKNKDTLVTGDLVKIGKEEFYVVSNNGTEIVLLAHYNLNVGEHKKEDAIEGIQNSEVKGWVSEGTKYGDVRFSETKYWEGKVGTTYPGNYCYSNEHSPDVNYAYVYDSNSELYGYVEYYKNYLINTLGLPNTIKARILKLDEVFTLGCGKGQWSCKTSPADAPSWVYETSYWIDGVRNQSMTFEIKSDGSFGFNGASEAYSYGVRPVITIKISDIE